MTPQPLRRQNESAALVGNASGEVAASLGGDEMFVSFSFVCSCAIIAIALFGICGNAVSIAIFSQKKMRALPINVLLIGLSSIDLAVVVCAVPPFGLMGIFNTTADGNGSDALLSSLIYAVHIAYPLAMVAQTCSVWLMLIITAERYIAVCRPLHAKRFCTIRKATSALVCTISLALLYNVSRFFEYRLVHEHSRTAELQPYLRQNDRYFAGFYVGAYVATHYFIPFSILTVLNVYMAFTIAKANAERQRLTGYQTAERKTSLMMVVIIFMFLLCNTIPFLLNLIEGVDRAFFSQDSSSFYVAYLLLDVGNLMVVINSSSTCIIYYYFSERYRQHFKKLICCMQPLSRHASINTSMYPRTSFVSDVSLYLPSSRRSVNCSELNNLPRLSRSVCVASNSLHPASCVRSSAKHRNSCSAATANNILAESDESLSRLVPL